MNTYDKFISRAGIAMRESAIRQMGYRPRASEGHDLVCTRLSGGGRVSVVGICRDGGVAVRRLGRIGAAIRPDARLQTAARSVRGADDQSRHPSVVERIVVTTGSQQGLDLLARVLVDPGDVILMELPSYTGAITAFRNVGASLVGVRQDDHGVELDTSTTPGGRRVRAGTR
jgi:hypothetical protein